MLTTSYSLRQTMKCNRRLLSCLAHKEHCQGVALSPSDWELLPQTMVEGTFKYISCLGFLRKEGEAWEWTERLQSRMLFSVLTVCLSSLFLTEVVHNWVRVNVKWQLWALFYYLCGTDNRAKKRTLIRHNSQPSLELRLGTLKHKFSSLRYSVSPVQFILYKLV